MKYLTNGVKKSILSAVFFALLSFVTQAQTIQIVEGESNDPIVGVAVFNKDKTVSEISDFNGEVSLKRFALDEKIYFKHVLCDQNQLVNFFIFHSDYGYY